MPKRSNPVQKLVHLIERQLSGEAVVRQSVEIPDRDNGEMREVDVVIDIQSGHHTLRIGVEVITGRAFTPWVERMMGMHLSGSLTDKLILVAGGGFSAPACAKAEAFGIETLTLAEAATDDWAARVAKYEQLWFAKVDLTPQEVSVTLEATPCGCAAIAVGPDTEVVSADGSRKATLIQLVHQFARKASVLKEVYSREDRDKVSRFEMDGTPDEPCFVFDDAGNKHRVMHLHVKGALRFAMAEVRMQQTSYRGAAVAHGGGNIGGQKLLVAGVEERGAEPVWSVNLAAGDNDPGLVVDLTTPGA